MEDEQSLRQRIANDAINILKCNARLFAAATVEIMDGVDSLNTKSHPLPPVHSPERLEYALKGLDLRARAYLELVSGIETQEAFATILRTVFADTTWSDYVGMHLPITGALVTGAHKPVVATIQDRIRVWIKRSYERVAKPEDQSMDTGQPVEKSQRVRSFLEPKPDLLKNHDATLNRKNAAQAVGVSERTLDRWVADGKLIPVGPGSRKRFRTKDLLRLLNKEKS